MPFPRAMISARPAIQGGDIHACFVPVTAQKPDDSDGLRWPPCRCPPASSPRSASPAFALRASSSCPSEAGPPLALALATTSPEECSVPAEENAVDPNAEEPPALLLVLVVLIIAVYVLDESREEDELNRICARSGRGGG